MKVRVLIALAAVALGAGCAADNRQFYINDGTGRHGSSSDSWAKDTYECKRDIMTSAIGFSRSVTAPYYAQQMAIECMWAKGYVYQ